IASGPADAVLGGHTTVRAVHGVATFTDLTLNVAGSYTLEATGGKLDPDTSNPFTVTTADITDDVRLERGRPHRVEDHDHRHDGGMVFEQTVTLTNTSGHTLSGPLAVVLDDLPDGVMLANATGTYRGHPYLDVPVGGASLAPGQRVTLTLRFVLSGHH